MPALSWSAIASRTARSSSTRSSPAVIVPARAASRASRRYSGRSRLPTTSARTTAVVVAIRDASFGRWTRARDPIRSLEPMLDVEGRVAFVTGGGSGVGLGMAKAFVRAGMRVAIADIRADHLEEATAELGGDVHEIPLDVTDREAFARAADETERALGPVHVLCNNAGINLSNDLTDATY